MPIHESSSRPKMKIVSMILAIVLVGGFGVSRTAYASSEGSSPTDEELLLGLVYGKGSVAEELGVTQERPAEVERKDYEKALDESVDGLLNDPEFKTDTDSALDQIRSNDPRIVEAGMDALGEVVIDQVETNLDKDPELKAEVEEAKESDRVDSQACGAAIVCVAYAAAAVHNTVVLTGLAAVVVGGALWAGVWAWVGDESELSPQMASKDKSAKREVLISDIAELS